MRDVIIFGAGQNGRFLNRLMQYTELDGEKYNPILFCDNNLPSGGYLDGLRVIEPAELLKRKEEIYISSEKFLDEIINQLRSMNLTNRVFFTPDYVFKLKKLSGDLPLGIPIDISKPRLERVEIMIAHHCNLNCKGCSAFANVAEPELLSIEYFTKELIRLHELFTEIKYLKLFGGEPLLHPGLVDFIRTSRKLFPGAKIDVHSNGLLVNKLDEEVFEEMSRLDVGFVFTLYPPTGKLQRLINEVLSRHNVEYKYMGPIYSFRKMVRKNSSLNSEDVYRNCLKCWGLEKGFLGCFHGFAEKRLEKMTGEPFRKNSDNHYEEEGLVNIFETDMDGWQINEYLNRPKIYCDSCEFMQWNKRVDEDKFFAWETGGVPLASDWIYEERS